MKKNKSKKNITKTQKKSKVINIEKIITKKNITSKIESKEVTKSPNKVLGVLNRFPLKLAFPKNYKSINLSRNLKLILFTILSLTLLFFLNFNLNSGTVTLGNFKDYILLNTFVFFVILVLILNLLKLFLEAYLTSKKDFDSKLTLNSFLRNILVDLGLINLNFVLVSIIKFNTLNLIIDVNVIHSLIFIKTLILLILIFRFVSQLFNLISLSKSDIFKYLVISLLILSIFIFLVFSNLTTFLIIIFSGILSLLYIHLTK